MKSWDGKRLLVIAAAVLASASPGAQQFPPGYVDPLPLLAAASKEIGEANLRCITFSGAGYGGAVGQTAEYAVNVDWPRIDALANYTRTINCAPTCTSARPSSRTERRSTSSIATC